MASSRYPGKALVPLAGRPLLEVLLERIASAPVLDSVALATSSHPENEVLVALARKMGIPAFQGDEEDVLRRHIDCARNMNAHHVVRVTGDNPLTDLETLERLVELHLASGDDYTYVPGDALLMGILPEVVSRSALERSWDRGEPRHRSELVTLYIKEHPEEFRIRPRAPGAVSSRVPPHGRRGRGRGLMQAIFERLAVPGKIAHPRGDRAAGPRAGASADERPPAPQGRQPPLGGPGRGDRREAMKGTFSIDGRVVGKGQPCYVIAEAGVNHNCDVALGRRLVDTAKASGADAIKFQSYTASRISTRAAPRYWYEPQDPRGTQWDTFDKLDKLSEADFRALLAHARQQGITAFSTPFDDHAVDLLASLEMPAFKIASADLTCHPLVERAARVGRPMILSTGTSTLGEVEEALEVCRRAGNEQVVLLHCTLKYPCPPEGINLRMMEHLMRAFPEVPVGLSDHSLGISVPQAAVALGACMVEKHYTVDKTLPGSPDHHLSVDPPELRAMVDGIRTVEKALGKAAKGLEPLERDAWLYARRSLTSAVAIPKGAALTRAMLTYKRPGTGISPRYFDMVVGRIARVDIPEDTTLTWEML
jgi:sialic acid synthase SpsE/spore coat polysaccharide biosynthesis protein SpsF (cytidylyltransferase family)